MDGGFFFAVVGIVFYTKYWKEAHTYVLHNTYHVLLKLDWPHCYIKFDYIMIPEECQITIPRFPESPNPRGMKLARELASIIYIHYQLK